GEGEGVWRGRADGGREGQQAERGKGRPAMRHVHGSVKSIGLEITEPSGRIVKSTARVAPDPKVAGSVTRSSVAVTVSTRADGGAGTPSPRRTLSSASVSSPSDSVALVPETGWPGIG